MRPRLRLRRQGGGSVDAPPPGGHEAVVLGGGPAGAAAAILLARRGHTVTLVRPASPPAGALAESVPPSACKTLAALGVLDAVERAGFVTNGGNTSWWAGRPARVESFPRGVGRPRGGAGGPRGSGGFHVDRAGLEAVLAEAARAAGVTVHDGAPARRAGRSDGVWTVERAGRRMAGPPFLRAPWVIDATGRHGILAREVRRPDRRTSTVAVSRRWRRSEGWGLPEPTHTLLESYRDGWVWSVPLAGGVRCFTAMIDARDAARRDARDPDGLLSAELSNTVHLCALLDGAEPVGGAWACPASLYDARSYASDGLVLAGDAGSFIDPLSSFGVKKALSSGWLAGVAVHTALVDSGMESAALAFFDAREREVYRSYRAASVPYFEEAAAAHAHPYWTTRAAAARAAGGAGSVHGGARPAHGDGFAVPTPPEADVRAAFDVIRARPALGAAAGRSVRVVERPAVEGERIVMAAHVTSETYPAGLRYVRGVDLVRLVEEAPRHAELPDVWTAYNGVAPPVPLPDFLVALCTAFAAGLLVHRD